MLLSWKHCSCWSKTSKSHLLLIIFVSSVKQWNITVNFSSLPTENLAKIPQSTQKKFILVFLTRERPSWKFGFAPGPRLCCPMLRCVAQCCLVSFAAVFRLVTQRSSPQTAAFFRTTFLSRIWPIRIWFTYRKSVRGIGKRPITARVLYVPSKWLLSTMKVFSLSWLLNLKIFFEHAPEESYKWSCKKGKRCFRKLTNWVRKITDISSVTDRFWCASIKFRTHCCSSQSIDLSAWRNGGQLNRIIEWNANRNFGRNWKSIEKCKHLKWLKRFNFFLWTTFLFNSCKSEVTNVQYRSVWEVFLKIHNVDTLRCWSYVS